MKKNPYSKIADPHLRLNDRLAIARTILANERTILAYFRTALAILISGVGLIRFFKAPAPVILGWCLLPLAVILAIIGLNRYKRMSKMVIKAGERVGNKQ